MAEWWQTHSSLHITSLHIRAHIHALTRHSSRINDHPRLASDKCYLPHREHLKKWFSAEMTQSRGSDGRMRWACMSFKEPHEWNEFAGINRQQPVLRKFPGRGLNFSDEQGDDQLNTERVIKLQEDGPIELTVLDQVSGGCGASCCL